MDPAEEFEAEVMKATGLSKEQFRRRVREDIVSPSERTSTRPEEQTRTQTFGSDAMMKISTAGSSDTPFQKAASDSGGGSKGPPPIPSGPLKRLTIDDNSVLNEYDIPATLVP